MIYHYFFRGSRTGLPTCYQTSIDCVEKFLVLEPVQFLSTWNSRAAVENVCVTGYQRNSKNDQIDREMCVMGLLLTLSPRGFETPENFESFKVRLLAPRAKC